MGFEFGSHAGNATIIAHGGAERYAEGASVLFQEESNGDTAQIQLSGNATVDISSHFLPGVTLGSINGKGIIYLGQNNLTLGANNRDGTISGLISDGGVNGGSEGSLTKIGKGELTLTFANTYAGRTGIERGRLTVNNTTGSGTGAGPVQVIAGTLGGNGIIAGTVTIGMGTGQKAVLTAGAKGGLGTLTIQQALTFNTDGKYDCVLSSNRSSADELIAAGVTIDTGATLSLSDKGSTTLPLGTVFTIISNTATTSIAGTFSNFADGSTVTIGPNAYQISYEGGDGNDVTLTVVP